ncbi:MAG: CbiQ family ECF transporter T component, partial [Armatimonadota bacterium]|nr:CbiQ family ECF transporter T component [Armatimonadota bacterium]
MALRAVPIGQYLPRDSAVHRLDPRTKILATTVLTVAVFLVGTFLGHALFAAVVAGLILVSRIPPRTVLAGLRPVLFLLLLTVLLNLLFSGTTGSRVLLRMGPVVLTVEAVTRAVFVGLRLLLLVV